MSGTGFCPFGMKLAGGTVEYKFLNELMEVGVNASFHLSTPSNAAGELCVNEKVEARHNTQTKAIRIGTASSSEMIIKGEFAEV